MEFTYLKNIYIEFIIVFVVLSLQIIDGNANEMHSKIVGGIKVPIEHYPSSVIFFTLGYMCAGSILNSVSVLTAAHCFDENKDIDQMSIHVGAKYMYDPTADMYSVAGFVIHPKYNRTMMFENDIAVLFLKNHLIFSDKVKKAMIVNHDEWMKNNVRNFVVTGWGQLQYDGDMADQLMMTELYYVPRDNCSRIHSIKLTPDMFCLYGDGKDDACKGDSGGGVLWKGMLVGVVSFGDECAKKDSPSMYSNVWYAKNWIESTITDYVKKHCSYKK